MEEDKKPNIILLESWREHFKLMTKEQVYDVIMAMYDYQYDGIEPESIPVEILHFWLMARKWIDDNNQRFGDICRKRKEVATNRWKKQKEKEMLAAMKPEERLVHEFIKKVRVNDEPIADYVSKGNFNYLAETVSDNFSMKDGNDYKFDEKTAKKCLNSIAKETTESASMLESCCSDDGATINYDKLVSEIVHRIEEYQ